MLTTAKHQTIRTILLIAPAIYLRFLFTGENKFSYPYKTLINFKMIEYNLN